MTPMNEAALKDLLTELTVRFGPTAEDALFDVVMSPEGRKKIQAMVKSRINSAKGDGPLRYAPAIPYSLK